MDVPVCDQPSSGVFFDGSDYLNITQDLAFLGIYNLSVEEKQGLPTFTVKTREGVLRVPRVSVYCKEMRNISRFETNKDGSVNDLSDLDVVSLWKRVVSEEVEFNHQQDEKFKRVRDAYLELAEHCEFHLTEEVLGSEERRSRYFWFAIRTSLLSLSEKYADARPVLKKSKEDQESKSNSEVSRAEKADVKTELNIMHRHLTHFCFTLCVEKYVQLAKKQSFVLRGSGSYNLVDILQMADVNVCKLFHFMVSSRNNMNSDPVSVLHASYEEYFKPEHRDKLPPQAVLDNFWFHRFFHDVRGSRRPTVESFEYSVKMWSNFNLNKSKVPIRETVGPVALHQYVPPVCPLSLKFMTRTGGLGGSKLIADHEGLLWTPLNSSSNSKSGYFSVFTGNVVSFSALVGPSGGGEGESSQIAVSSQNAESSQHVESSKNKRKNDPSEEPISKRPRNEVPPSVNGSVVSTNSSGSDSDESGSSSVSTSRCNSPEAAGGHVSTEPRPAEIDRSSPAGNLRSGSVLQSTPSPKSSLLSKKRSDSHGPQSDDDLLYLNSVGIDDMGSEQPPVVSLSRQSAVISPQGIASGFSGKHTRLSPDSIDGSGGAPSVDGSVSPVLDSTGRHVLDGSGSPFPECYAPSGKLSYNVIDSLADKRREIDAHWKKRVALDEVMGLDEEDFDAAVEAGLADDGPLDVHSSGEVMDVSQSVVGDGLQSLFLTQPTDLVVRPYGNDASSLLAASNSTEISVEFLRECLGSLYMSLSVGRIDEGDFKNLCKSFKKLKHRLNELGQDDYTFGSSGNVLVQMIHSENPQFVSMVLGLASSELDALNDSRSFLHKLSLFLKDTMKLVVFSVVDSTFKDASRSMGFFHSLMQVSTACKVACCHFGKSYYTFTEGDNEDRWPSFVTVQCRKEIVKMPYCKALYNFVLLAKATLVARDSNDAMKEELPIEPRLCKALLSLLNFVYEAFREEIKKVDCPAALSFRKVQTRFDNTDGARDVACALGNDPSVFGLLLSLFNISLDDDSLAKQITFTLFSEVRNEDMKRCPAGLSKNKTFAMLLKSSWQNPFVTDAAAFNEAAELLSDHVLHQESPVHVYHLVNWRTKESSYSIRLARPDAGTRSLDLHAAFVQCCVAIQGKLKTSQLNRQYSFVEYVLKKALDVNELKIPSQSDSADEESPFEKCGGKRTWYGSDGQLIEGFYADNKSLEKIMFNDPRTLLYNRPSPALLRTVFYEDHGVCTCVGDCGFQCINRISRFECHEDYIDHTGRRRPSNCAFGGTQCSNRKVTNMTMQDLLSDVEISPTFEKGDILLSKKDFYVGELKILYSGEMLTSEMAGQRRAILEGHNKPMYLMELSKDVFVDAKMAGNAAKEISHSCDPNCQANKTIVKGCLSVVIENIKPIKSGEEITFCYFRKTEAGKKKGFICQCSSTNCVDAKSDDEGSTASSEAAADDSNVLTAHSESSSTVASSSVSEVPTVVDDFVYEQSISQALFIKDRQDLQRRRKLQVVLSEDTFWSATFITKALEDKDVPEGEGLTNTQASGETAGTSSQNPHSQELRWATGDEVHNVEYDEEKKKFYLRGSEEEIVCKVKRL